VNILKNLTPEEFKQAQNEAMDLLIQSIDKSFEQLKIKGTNFSQEKADKYVQISVLCQILFKGEPTNAKIEVEEPTNEKPFVGVKVYMDEFELGEKNKKSFNELINLADDVIFYGEEEDYFHISFYVYDIWT